MQQAMEEPIEKLIDVAMWSKAADDITWIKRPRAVMEKRVGADNEHNPYVWFPGGTLNTCYNCVDRQDQNQVALIYDSPVSGTKRQYTFGDIRDEVVHLAGLLHDDYGVRKGDTVLIYMPMVPEAAFCMLACARLGAVHSVVFGKKEFFLSLFHKQNHVINHASCIVGGFAPKELAKRIQDAQPKVLVTASCGIEPTRVIPYKRKQATLMYPEQWIKKDANFGCIFILCSTRGRRLCNGNTQSADQGGTAATWQGTSRNGLQQRRS